LSQGNSGGSSNWLKWLIMCATPTNPMRVKSCRKGTTGEAVRLCEGMSRMVTASPMQSDWMDSL
jgi:hypothetical protein